MRFKIASVCPSPSATSARDTYEEKGEKSFKAATPTLQGLYRSLLQRLSLANMSHTMKRNLRIAGIVFACLLVVLVALPFLIGVNRFLPKVESEASMALRAAPLFSSVL